MAQADVKLGKSETDRLRREGGAELKRLREQCGLTQRELANRVGFDYYTFIAQIEGGRGRLPPDRYQSYADALGVPHQDFARLMLRYYEPVTYRLLFGENP
ncbi:helix-turn-helix domain-containing protein [Rhodocista pekingensis]|uniref:Helix-turn-helix domain-containing protein n=1 Tax=Rhodocista pekingensis TaxID=201185 RepID=A0ABW2KRI7_9PROT